MRSTLNLAGKKILIVGLHYAPEVTGNAPYTTAMARHFAQLNAKVHVITGVPHYPEWKVPLDYRFGIRWHETDGDVRLTRIRHVVPSRMSAQARAAQELSFITAASPYVLGAKADAIIGITPTISGASLGLLAKWTKRAPLGLIVQDLMGNAATESGSASSRLGQTVSSVEYALMRKVDAIGVIAPRFGEIITENGVSRDRIFSTPNFVHIDRSPLSRDEARDVLSWPRDRFIALHTGNMGMKQGLATVVDAARLARSASPSIDFYFVGNGNQREKLQLMASDLPNVRFIDVLPADLYAHALAAADALILNERATVKEMSLPSKLTSYLAAGRPIVAAVADGGTSARLAKESGACITVPAGSSTGIVDALDQLASDPVLARDLASGGAAFALERLSLSAGLKGYERFLHRILGG